ncbi:hypothetical protein EV177_007060 [Coemansia sp. RSA 1804]|nr:hypothetical protein EV177_007060 [Coemansia sp. RSA 1804]
MAAIHGDAAIVEFLIHNGADANALTVASLPSVSTSCTRGKPTDKGSTRHQRNAKSRGSLSLLKAAATDSSAISSPMGTVPGLHSMQDASAVSCDSPSFALSSACASCVSDPDCTDDYCGATPLHFAVANGHSACADVLLSCGARTDVADSYGNTPETLAVACACGDMLDVFEHWRQFDAESDELWLKTVATMAAKKGLGSPLQLPSPDPSVVCFAESPRASEPDKLVDDEQARPVDAELSRHRISRSATGPLPSQNVSGTGSTAEPCQANDHHSILPRRHTAGETTTAQHQPLAPASQGMDRNWQCVFPSTHHSSSAPESLERERSGFYQTAPKNVVRLSASASTRRRPAPGRIACIPQRHCISEITSYSPSMSSRRERSYTDSVIEQAWRKYLEFDDESARDSAQCMAANNESQAENADQPLPELWMWKQAAIAVRNRRSKSLSAQQQQQDCRLIKPM